MSSYFDIFSSIFQTGIEVWPKRRITWTFLQDFVVDMREYGRISLHDVVNVTSVAVLLTLLRSILTTYIFTPFALSMKFTPKNIGKFPESSWKFLYYLTMYIYTCVLLFGKDYPFYTEPNTCWTESWSVGVEIPSDIYYLYCIHASFYIHSIYATFYMDPWRRDSIAMIIHHVLTVFLICFSFAVRYYKVGIVVLFLHDICDVFLEFTKICICFKIRDNKKYYIFEVIINIGFLLFSFSWFYCRLYLFPYKVLYPAGHYAVHVLPHAPFYYFFNGMLLFLFGLDVWWFHFIILLMWKVLTGQSREIKDTRDVGVQEDDFTNSSCTDTENNHSVTGDVLSNGNTVINGNQHFIKENGKQNGNESKLPKESNGLVDNLRYRQSHSLHSH